MSHTLLECDRIEQAVNSRLREFRREFPVTEDGAEACITPLLTGLLLNGAIIDAEKEFLDGLAPEGALTFLIKNETYIHPEQVPLFPHDLIDCAISQGGEAMFGHRYQPRQSRSTSQEYKIYTALINPGHEEKLVLGFFGPAHAVADPATQQRFSGLLSTFRTAYQKVSADHNQLAQLLDSNSPTLLVNRASGVILAVNQRLTDVTTEPQAGAEFTSVKDSLALLLTGSKICMDQIELAGMSLTVVRFAPIETDEAAERHLSEGLINRIRASLSGITLANSLMSQPATDDTNSTASMLAGEALAEAEKIELWLQRAYLVVNFRQLPIEPCRIIPELQRSVDSPGLGHGNFRINLDGVKRDFTTEAPADAYFHLFSTLLAAHQRACLRDGETSITLAADSGSGLEVRIITISCERAGTIEPDHKNYSQHLSRLLKVQLVGPIKTEPQQIESIITINKLSKRIGHH